VMITHERPGLMASTVSSFRKNTPNMDLTVIDDGSSSCDKKAELEQVARSGVRVLQFVKRGFIGTWMAAFEWLRVHRSGWGGVILLEDDLSFARDWADVLHRMYEGTADLGLMPGLMSCFRIHGVPQNAIVNLRGIDAYQSMGSSFQVNLMPWEVVEAKEVLEEAAFEGAKHKRGLDAVLMGLISHRLGRTSFVSMRSWVAHEGVNKSLVKDQGYLSLGFRGHELVEELQ
jgi:hypothetical protein